MSSSTTVFLLRPQICRSFDVAVSFSETSGELSGTDLLNVARFLRLASERTLFDLEWDGRVYRNCRVIGGQGASGSIGFTCDGVHLLAKASATPDIHSPLATAKSR